MTKGADSIMLPRCDFQSEADQEANVKIMQDLLSFAKEGLRTLVVAQKEITEEMYLKFDAEYHKLKTSAANDKDDKLDELYSKYE